MLVSLSVKMYGTIFWTILNILDYYYGGGVDNEEMRGVVWF